MKTRPSFRAATIAPAALRARRGWIRPTLVMIVAALVFAALFMAGAIPAKEREANARKEATRVSEAAPNVSTFKLGKRASNSEVQLPGNVQALIDAPIFARTSGYLNRRLVDIGDKVTSGQLLAVIESPETDQELRQARANALQARASVIQAQSKLDLAQISYARQKTLAQQKAVAQQEADQSQANFAVAQADLEAARATFTAREAEVSRLIELTGYQEIKAPFDGIITARNIEAGALVNAGTGAAATSGPSGSSGGGAGKELFRLADTTIFRVYVNVPQRFAPMIRAGQQTELRIPETAGKTFKGRVARTAGAVDQASRTMLVEVQLPNPQGQLLAGMYAQVKFLMSNAEAPLVIPSNALLIRPDGVRVVVVGPDRRVSLRKAELGRDYGSEIELLSGASAGDSIVTTPPDDLSDGAPVEIASAPETQEGTQKPAK